MVLLLLSSFPRVLGSDKNQRNGRGSLKGIVEHGVGVGPWICTSLDFVLNLKKKVTAFPHQNTTHRRKKRKKKGGNVRNEIEGQKANKQTIKQRTTATHCSHTVTTTRPDRQKETYQISGTLKTE